MWIFTVFFLCFYGMRTSLGQVGSPWNTGSENDYYYEQLHPEDDLPVITTDNQQFAVNLGDPLVLPCPINNLGHFTLIWRRGGQILWVLQDRGDGRPFVQTVLRDPRVSRNGTSLIIGGVLPDDENTYTCEISTRPPRSVSHTLTVKVPPTVYPAYNRSIVTIKIGDTTILGCIVSGNPTPIVTWTKEGQGLPLGDGANLTVTKAKPEDNGVYRCTADNGGEDVYASINLQVMHSPDVKVDKSEVYSGVSYDAILACYVNATPRPQVRWYRKNGAPVDPLRLKLAYDTRSSRHSLQFKRVQNDDFGYYSCNASNFMGNSSAVVTLTGRPKPVRYLSPSTGDESNRYTLVWEVESYSPVLAYSIAYRNETDSVGQWVTFTVPGTTSSSIYHSKKHTFTELETGASYYVQVSAKNEFGNSDVNETFAFSTLDPVGTDPPEDLLHEEEEEEDEEEEEEEEEELTPNNDQYQDVVSEVGGVTESQAPPPSEVDDATAQSPIISPTDNLTESDVILQENFQGNEIPAAEKASVSDGSSETYSITPREKRAQMVALVTAISLSSFFL